MIRAALIGCLLVLPLSAKTLQEERWEKAKLRPERVSEISRIVERFPANKSRYDEVAERSKVPAHVVFFLQNMEASGSFAKHLHEGSPLTGRTKWVPKGRPTWGKPPFRWEDSAVDALAYDKMSQVNWNSLHDSLWGFTRYNGTGYDKYHPNVPTPYLWSGTTIYQRGKYTGDGKFDPYAVSKQIGIAAIWKRMIQLQLMKEP
jgi:lysozyme family protein